MFQKFGQKFQQFMIGRNGPDDLSRFALFAAFLFMLASVFLSDAAASQVLIVIAFAGIAYCYFRVFSRKTGNRYKENRIYVGVRTKVTAPLRHGYARFKEWKAYHKTHRIYTCKQCGQSLRVPKGKGTVRVSCPKCKNSFTTKS